jgi:hypothetical protein
MLKIQKWVKTPSSEILWVQGPVSVVLEEQLTFTTLHISNSLLNAGVPCVSYYARYRPKSQLKGVMATMTSREAAMIDLLYSLI